MGLVKLSKNDEMASSVGIEKVTAHPTFRLLIPFAVMLLHCYSLWAFSHQFCYKQLYQRRNFKGACIGLMVVVLFLSFLAWYIWALMVFLGPGRQPIIPPFKIVPDSAVETVGTVSNDSMIVDNSITPPDIYPCDERGYPVWCSNCQSVKMSRTHHSSKLGYCVPRFDHYCVWIGTVVGRLNYKLFVQFAFYLDMVFLVFVISIATQLKLMKGHANGNVYTAFALACCALLMTGPLFLTHVYYMCYNKTSIEIIELNNKAKASRKYFCIYNPCDGYRYVVQFFPGESQDFWNKGTVLVNLKEFLGANYLLWFVPEMVSHKTSYGSVSGNYYELMGECNEVISERFQKYMIDKIERKEYITRLMI